MPGILRNWKRSKLSVSYDQVVSPLHFNRLDRWSFVLAGLEDREGVMTTGTRMLVLSCIDGELVDAPAECDDSELFAVHVSIGVGQADMFTITHLPTGLAVARMLCSREDAWAVVQRLLSLGWDWKQTDHHYFEAMRQQLDFQTRRWLELIKL